MSARTRVSLIVAAVACAAAGLTVGLTIVTAQGESRGSAPKPRSGVPPLLLDLGVRIDREATDLRRAARLYSSGHRSDAARIFRRYRSLQARVGLAFASWPDDSLATVGALVTQNPRSAFAYLHLGLADFWAGRNAAALGAWRRAERVEPDSSSAVHADDLLHPEFAQGLPTFLPSFPAPPGLSRLSPPRQLAALAAAARKPQPHAKLLYGIALQRLGKPRSAERQYAAAAALAPEDPEALAAAAVGLFSKAAPGLAFSRLGPLARRFPHAPTVRYHLGLLLLWSGKLLPARKELQMAVSDDPRGVLGREAKRLLDRLRDVQKG